MFIEYLLLILGRNAICLALATTTSTEIADEYNQY